MAQSTSLQSAIKNQRLLGMKGEHWDNYAAARYTLEGELGLNGQTAQHFYDLNREEYNTLLAHGRQDAAHALCNTQSLLDLTRRVSRQVRLLNVLLFALVCMIGAIVYKLYPELSGAVH